MALLGKPRSSVTVGGPGGQQLPPREEFPLRTQGLCSYAEVQDLLIYLRARRNHCPDFYIDRSKPLRNNQINLDLEFKFIDDDLYRRLVEFQGQIGHALTEPDPSEVAFQGG